MKTTKHLPLVLIFALAGCAQNKYGVPIYKKPDLTGIVGTPWKKPHRPGWIRSFPIYVGKWVEYGPSSDREISDAVAKLGQDAVIARSFTPDLKKMLPPAKFAGAEIWVYEWDLPDDGINNGFYSVVAVKNGSVVGAYEERADKWIKHPSAHKHFKNTSNNVNRQTSSTLGLRLRTTWQQLTGQRPRL